MDAPDTFEIRSHEELQRHLIVETCPGEALDERPRANVTGRSRSPRRNGRRIPIE